MNPPTSRAHRLLRGSGSKILYFVVSIGISFFLMPYLVRTLGDQQYGVWTLLGSLLGYYGLLDLGLSSAVVRFISRSVGQNDQGVFKSVFSTSFYLFLGLGAVAVVLTVIVSLFLPLIIKDPANLSLYRALVLLLGINTAIDFPVRTFNSVFTSHLRDDISTGITLVKTVLATALIVWTVQKGYGLLGMAVVSVGFSLLDSLMRIVLAKKIEPWVTIDPSFFDKGKLRPLFGYSSIAFLGRLANILRFRLDQLVITAFVNVSAVTHYFVATRLIEYLTDLMGQGAGVIMPLFSQDEGQGQFDKIRQNFLFLSKISMYMGVFLSGLTLLYGKPFILRWMGQDFHDSAQLLLLFMIPFSLQLVQAPIVPLLDGISKHRYYVFANIGEGFLNLILSLCLVQTMGIFGVAWGTVVPMLIKHVIFHPWYACRAIDLSLVLYGRRFFQQGLLAVAFLIIGWTLTRRLPVADYGSMALGVFIQGAVFCPLILFIGFSSAERGRLLSLIQSILPWREKLA